VRLNPACAAQRYAPLPLRRHLTRKATQTSSSKGYSAMSDTESPSDSDHEHDAQTATSKTDHSAGFLQKTAFDAYFLQSSKSSKTSSNVFTDAFPPLSRQEYVDAMSRVAPPTIGPLSVDTVRPWFKQYMRELIEGFNLLFFGLGSKREVLNVFAREACSKRGHVVLVNAYRPDFVLKDLLLSVEKVPGITSEALSAPGIEGQTQRICRFFSAPSQKPARVFLVIHNIDAPALRTAKAAACLSTLALAPYVHIAASVDHINAPLLFSASDAAARKRRTDDAGAGARGYAWLWHDATTLAPYDAELAFADRGSVSGASGVSARAAQAATSGDGGVPMTETAAQHVLASVTQRAKKLFVLLATRQLAAMDDAGDAAAREPRGFGIAYDALFAMARDEFVATSDAALRALLGEYKDHGLIVSDGAEGAGGKETLSIPLRKERLTKVLQALSAE
jgi:origin recognition complex subunit 2